MPYRRFAPLPLSCSLLPHFFVLSILAQSFFLAAAAPDHIIKTQRKYELRFLLLLGAKPKTASSTADVQLMYYLIFREKATSRKIWSGLEPIGNV
ncbi:unnamed protein product, partial [Mesorhabditis spiculigera]